MGSAHNMAKKLSSLFMCKCVTSWNGSWGRSAAKEVWFGSILPTFIRQKHFLLQAWTDISRSPAHSSPQCLRDRARLGRTLMYFSGTRATQSFLSPWNGEVHSSGQFGAAIMPQLLRRSLNCIAFKTLDDQQIEASVYSLA